MLINEIEQQCVLEPIIIKELRELYGIKYRPEKKNKKEQVLNGGFIFKSPLHNLELVDVILSSGGIVQIPRFVSDACQKILEQVTVEGLFRKAGAASRQREIRANLESGLPLGKSSHVIDVANIVKMFFRELPDPILAPGNIQECILRCLLCGDKKINAVLMTCLLIPSLSLSTLAFFMQFLNTVTIHSDSNKMTVENLAIIFAPGLMPLVQINGNRLNSHVKVIKLLIENAHDIALVPSTVIEKLNLYSEKTFVINNSDVPATDRKKKKRRSGSLTRMFNGLRRMVAGTVSSNESLNKTIENAANTPHANKSTKKRKGFEANPVSVKKKKDLLPVIPQASERLFSTSTSIKRKSEKTRLSLGGKQIIKVSNENKNTINIPPLDRRWSIINTTGWKRKTISTMDDKLETVTSSTLDINQIDDVQKLLPLENVQNSIVLDEVDYLRISKSEYEEIKERVSAIESKISKEFENVDSALHGVIHSPNGPAKVLSKYEKALEETEMINDSVNDQLARRISRELKIRRSAEFHVIRSPSARKIGSARRRSRENVRLARNFSWHSRNDCQDTHLSSKSPKALYLEDSRTNEYNTEKITPQRRSLNNCLQNKSIEMIGDVNTPSYTTQWMSAEKFFETLKSGNENNSKADGIHHENIGGYARNENTTTPVINTTRRGSSTIKVTPNHLKLLKNCSGLRDQQNCRESIARLRSFNAGMVMAKAKLFNELGTNDNIQTIGNKIDNKQCIRHKRNSKSPKAFMSANTSTSATPNDAIVFATPVAPPRNRVSSRSNRKYPSSQQRNTSIKRRRNGLNFNTSPTLSSTESPKTFVSDIKLKGTQRNPPKSLIADNDSTTPIIKRSLFIKSPNGLIKTPRRRYKNQSPLKATPVKCSQKLLVQRGQIVTLP